MAAVLGRGGREGERLEQSGACKRGDVPEEGTRSRTEEQEGCRERQCPGSSYLGFSRRARLGALTSRRLQPHSARDQSALDEIPWMSTQNPAPVQGRKH